MSLVAAESDAPALAFRVEGVEALAHAAAPTLAFRLAVEAERQHDVRSLALNVQIRIEAAQRGYDAGERGRLFELFGASRDWARSLRSLRWTSVSLTVPPFSATTSVELAVPCTYDFDVAAAKYLHALAGDDVPLVLLFSGSVFYRGAGGRLQVVHLPADCEARCRMPLRVWREALERSFPGTAWLRLRRDVFDRLQAYKSERALLTWEAALEQLLEEHE